MTQPKAIPLSELKTEREGIVSTYILWGINKCVEQGVLEYVLRCPVSITVRGMINCGKLQTSEQELRDMFSRLQNLGYIHEALEFSDVFNGIISKGEVIH